jgi:hypothetical protein
MVGVQNTSMEPTLPVQAKDHYLILHANPSPEQEAAWRDFLTRVEMPSHYDSLGFFLEPWWQKMRPFAVLALAGGRIVGSLTGIHAAGEVRCGHPTRPQISFDRTANQDTVADILVEGLMAEASRAKLATIYSWTRLPVLERRGFRTRQMEGDVVLDLTLGSDALLKQFHPNRRRNIRFATQKGLEVSLMSGEKDIEEAYQLHCAWRRTSRKKIVARLASLASFKQSWGLSENRRVFLVRHSGQLIAADVVRFYPGGLLEAAANFSLDQFLYLKPNDLVVWKIIEWACQQGFTRFSLGGAHSFLRYFGGEVVPIYRLRLDRTWLHRYDLREAIEDAGRRALTRTPKPVEKLVRRILGKS